MARFISILIILLLNSATSFANTGKQIGVVSILKNFASAGIDENETILTGGDRIFPGQKIKTLMNSKVQILFLDQSIVNIGPDTEIVINAYVDQTKNPNFSVEVERGIVRFESGDLPPNSYQIKSPNALVTLEGTKVDLLVSKSGETEIVLRDGRANVTQKELIKQDNQNLTSPRKTVTLKDPNTFLRVVSLRNETTEPRALTREKSEFYEDEIPIKPNQLIQITRVNPRRISAEVELNNQKGTRALNRARLKSDNIVRNINKALSLTKLINQQLRKCSGSACRLLLNKKKMLRRVKRNLKREARIILRKIERSNPLKISSQANFKLLNDARRLNAKILATIATAEQALAEADAAQRKADAKQKAALTAKRMVAQANQTMSDALQKADEAEKAKINANKARLDAVQAEVDAKKARQDAERAAADAIRAEAEAINAKNNADTATVDAANLVTQKSADASDAAAAAAKAANDAEVASKKAEAAQTAAATALEKFNNAQNIADSATKNVKKLEDRKAEILAIPRKGRTKAQKKELNKLTNKKKNKGIKRHTNTIKSIEKIPEEDRSNKEKQKLKTALQKREELINNPGKGSIDAAKNTETNAVDARDAANTAVVTSNTVLTNAESARDAANQLKTDTNTAAEKAASAEKAAKDVSNEATKQLAQKTTAAQEAAEKASNAQSAANIAVETADSAGSAAEEAAKALAQKTADAKAAAEKAAAAKAAAESAALAANSAAAAAAEAARILAQKTADAKTATEKAADAKAKKRKSVSTKTGKRNPFLKTTNTAAMSAQSTLGGAQFQANQSNLKITKIRASKDLDGKARSNFRLSPFQTKQTKIQTLNIRTKTLPSAAVQKTASKKAKAAAAKASKQAKVASKKAKAAAAKASKQAKVASKKAKAAAAKASKQAKAASKKAKAAAAKAAKQAKAASKKAKAAAAKAAKQAKAASKKAKAAAAKAAKQAKAAAAKAAKQAKAAAAKAAKQAKAKAKKAAKQAKAAKKAAKKARKAARRKAAREAAAN